MRDTKDQSSNKDQSFIIPADYFVCQVDFDAKEPFCIVATHEPTLPSGDIKIILPKSLAYYLATHFCGSQRMHDNLIEDGKRIVQNAIKNILDLGNNN